MRPRGGHVEASRKIATRALPGGPRTVDLLPCSSRPRWKSSPQNLADSYLSRLRGSIGRLRRPFLEKNAEAKLRLRRSKGAAGGGTLSTHASARGGTPTIADAAHRRSSTKNGGRRPPMPSPA